MQPSSPNPFRIKLRIVSTLISVAAGLFYSAGFFSYVGSYLIVQGIIFGAISYFSAGLMVKLVKDTAFNSRHILLYFVVVLGTIILSSLVVVGIFLAACVMILKSLGSH